MVVEHEHLRVKLLDGLSIGGLDACWEWQGSRSKGYGLRLAALRPSEDTSDES